MTIETNNLSPVTANATVQQASNEAVSLVDQTKEMKQSQLEGAGEVSLSADEVANAIRQLNEIASAQSRDLKFSYDEQAGRTIVRVYDSNSQELIRQIPGDEILSIAHQFSQGDKGALLSAIA